MIDIPSHFYKNIERIKKGFYGSIASQNILNAVKTGTPLTETPKGRWIKEESILGWDGYSYQCSNCGRSIHLDTVLEELSDYPYCHCGAEMSGGKEDGDSN